MLIQRTFLIVDIMSNILIKKYGMSPEEYTFKFLDTIDLIPYFCYDDIFDIMDAIDEEHYEDDYINNAFDLFEENVFNWVNSDDFIEYINKRYKGQYKVVERVKYVVEKIKS